jgi:transcriptional regulator with XRE-family HTH domain
MEMAPKYLGRSKAAVGARLRISREAYGLDQMTFAKKAGLKSSTYNQYERGVNHPQIEAGLALKDAFRLSLDWVYDGDPSGLSYKLHEAILSAMRLRSEHE